MIENISLIDIKNESDKTLSKGSAEEISDIIYDTLFGNTQFPQFDLDLLSEIDEQGTTQEVNRKEKRIVFGYLGHVYKLNVEQIK